MQERLIENWLTKANEKSFQIPFCQLLTAEGYRVVHLSRHGPFEEGKDVLAIAPDGKPCAFQLKGSTSGKITQREWSKYVDQVTRLVELPIKHPSIDESLPRRVYFVTNGELDEEVRLEIVHRNDEWRRREYPELEVITKGDLLTRLIDLQDDLWPQPLAFDKSLLEFYLADGHGYLNKPKYAAFMEGLIIRPDLSRAEAPRHLASSAIFASYALTPFSEQENHVALIEGRLIYLACLISLVEKLGLPERYWDEQVSLTLEAIDGHLTELFFELKDKEFITTGDPLADAPFFRGRITWLISLMSVYRLRNKHTQADAGFDLWISGFIHDNFQQLELWGEAATPQLLAIVWMLNRLSLGYKADSLLYEIVRGIVELNVNGNGLPDPYHYLAEVVMN